MNATYKCAFLTCGKDYKVKSMSNRQTDKRQTDRQRDRQDKKNMLPVLCREIPTLMTNLNIGTTDQNIIGVTFSDIVAYK